MAPSVDGMEGCLSPTALAKIFPITNEDITSVSEPFGWLTDVAIRTIILRERCDASQYHTINFVDPTFLERWEDDLITGLHQASHAAIPTFLLPRLDSDWPSQSSSFPSTSEIFTGLPFTSIFVRKRAETLMQCFFAEYRHYFHGDPEAGLVFEDARAAQQNDGSSCGLYTIKNCVTLLKGESPDSRTWNFSQILKIREACARVMREEEEAQFEDSEKELKDMMKDTSQRELEVQNKGMPGMMGTMKVILQRKHEDEDEDGDMSGLMDIAHNVLGRMQEDFKK